ncbi:MAG: hypothetical protein EP341_05665 [Sphingomonadales bacterium]|nr:MAG: hypothetical protein EP341_05665 [Sphingomonadales bacterium]
MTRISSIYNHGNADPPTGEEAQRRNREAFAQAWQSMGLIVIYPEQVLDDWIRQAFVNEATKQYGKQYGKRAGE